MGNVVKVKITVRSQLSTDVEAVSVLLLERYRCLGPATCMVLSRESKKGATYTEILFSGSPEPVFMAVKDIANIFPDKRESRRGPVVYDGSETEDMFPLE